MQSHPMKIEPVTITEPPHYAVTSCRAIDGDAFECIIALPLGVFISTRVRPRGFFAPELDGTQPAVAREAKERLQRALDSHEVHLLSRGSKRDKYGRLVCYVLLDGRGADPCAILGPCQMAEADHTRELRLIQRSRAGKAGAL